MRSGLATARATPVKAVSGFVPKRAEKACAAERLARDTFSTVLQFSATRSAILSAVGVVSVARNSRIRAPVLIPIGQGIAQVPSPAHVSIPSYWYSSCNRASIGDPGDWRAISRLSTILCLGVMVTLRLGQTGSQNPHSMHCEEPVTPSI
jgi:hypothetical protein